VKRYLWIMLFLMGCAPIHFTNRLNPQATSEQFERDKYQCDLETTQWLKNSGRSLLGYQKQFKKCMAVRGWVA
jgi:gamma-glutamylcysteine synthetase